MRQIILIIAAPILYLTAFSTFAADYQHGHQALQIFDADGFKNAPQWVQIWVIFMMLSFLSGLFFVKNHGIARWVVGGMFAGMAFGIFAGSVLGLPALSGFIALIHLVFWSPGLFLLLKKRPYLGSLSPFSIWSGIITAVIIFSFVFDIRDAFLYLQHIF